MRNSQRKLSVLIATTLVIFLGIVDFGWAGGPVPAASLPGGALVEDSDDGAGESWGRSVGRDFTFSNFDLDRFTQHYILRR